METKKLKRIVANSGDLLIEWFQEDLDALMQPDQIPDESTADVKAYKMHLYWLKDKIALIRRIQKPDSESDELDSYE